MKRKDDLIRLAFGELSTESARAVESQAEPADKVEIDSFRRLHDELRHLPPPPPDSLSAERLRAAILDRELKVRKPFAWGQLLLAPAALAAIAAVVILPRLRPQPGVQIVSLNETQRQQVTGPNLGGKPELQPLVAVAPQFQGRIVESRARVSEPKSQPSMALAAIPSRRHRHPRRHHDAPAATVEEPQTMDTTGLVAMTPKQELDVPMTISAPRSSLVEAAPGTSGETETVVVVSSKRDLETGAPAATEQEASSVLVGG